MLYNFELEDNLKAIVSIQLQRNLGKIYVCRQGEGPSFAFIDLNCLLLDPVNGKADRVACWPSALRTDSLEDPDRSGLIIGADPGPYDIDRRPS